MKLLLLSNSTNPGEEYLGWALDYLSDFYRKHGVRNILFIPYAGVTVEWNAYEQKVRQVYQHLGLNLTSVHHQAMASEAVLKAEAIAVGGGNTFQLLKLVQENKLISPIRRKVLEGMPYSGWSAGSNLACPTLKTTNDMPIAEPESFDALSLVKFQINPHYLDAHPQGHGGETRQQRIEEFLEINRQITVAGLREASLIEMDGNRIELKGRKAMRVFRYGKKPAEYEPGSDIDFLKE